MQLHPGRMRLLKFGMLIFLVMHWNACLYAAIGKMALNSAKATWLTNLPENSFCDVGVSFLSDDHFYTLSPDDDTLESSTQAAQGDGDGDYVRLRCIHEMKWTHQYIISF